MAILCLWAIPGLFLCAQIRESHENTQLLRFLADKGGVCRRTPRKLQTETAGSIIVEYTVLMVAVALSSSAAIYAIGMPLIARYRFMKLLLGLPLP